MAKKQPVNKAGSQPDKSVQAAPLSPVDRIRARVLSGGFLRDLPDPRDWLAERIIPRGLQLAQRVDLRAGCSPVEDQGGLGSCTAQAGVGLMEYFDRLPDGLHVDLSRLALYYWEREAMGTTGQDSGASIRQCLKQLAKGVCREELCPYDLAKYADAPSSEAAADRENHRVLDYYRAHPLRQQYMAKAALMQGLPVICGVLLHESALSEETAKTGALRMPLYGDKIVGGHAVLLVGYDDLRDVFFFRNSWGEDWGDKGYGTLPQSYIAAPKLTSDMWVARKVTC